MDKRKTPVYQRLKLLVLRYSFLPNEPLRPNDLAPHLGVSATPLREALGRLYAEGLIMQTPNKGFFAKQLNEREMADLFEHAFLVLRHAAAKDVDGFTLSGINKPLELTFDANGRVIDITPDLLHSHAKFLEQLYERIALLSRNESMVAAVRSFNDRTHYIRLLDLETRGHFELIAPAVFGLIECLHQGDVAGVATNLEDQMARIRAALPALVREGISRAYATKERGQAEASAPLNA